MQTFNLLIDNHITFVATVTEKDDCCIKVTVEEVTAWDTDNQPCDKNHYLHAYIKWDGCSHVYFGELMSEDSKGSTDGYLHLCGAYDWKKHAILMIWLYKLAEKEIAHFSKDEILN